MPTLQISPQPWGVRYWFRCPGCKVRHAFACRTDGKGPTWTFDGNLAQPTFSPSLLVSGVRPITDDEHSRIMRGEHVEPEPIVCHSFVRDGQIQFLGDCTHHLAGQTMPIPDRDEEP